MANNSITVRNETVAIFGDPSIGDQFLSFNPESFEERVRMFNAINSPDKKLSDMINTPISVKDMIITKVKLTPRNNPMIKDNPPEGFVPENERTEEEDGFRVIMLDTEGVSYTATSRGIYNSICNLRAVFGTLHFEDGLRMVVKQISTKNGNTLTINLV